MLSEEFILSLF